MRNSIRSEMTVSWANLLGTQSKKLRGFGEVDPRLAEVLDQRVIGLSKIAFELAKLFEEDAGDASGEENV